jgi:formate dehydrogenase subunit gamma
MTEKDSDKVAALVAAKKHLPGALLPILHDVQDLLGYIPAAAIKIIAKALGQTSAEVLGVISFYHHFRTERPGENILEICRGEACQAMGSRALEAYAKQKLAVDFEQMTKDSKVTLAPVYCLGNCACAPSIKVGNKVSGRVTAAKLEQIIEQLDSQVIEISGGQH